MTDTIKSRIWQADCRGKVCAQCGKEFAADEVVFRFRSLRYSWNSACCSACRPFPDSECVKWSTPAPCAGCGRLMVYQLGMPGKTPIICSRQCSIDATRRKRRRQQQRTCIVCKINFTPERSDALTCSHRCRQKAYRDRARDNKKQVIISPASNRHGAAEA